MKLSQSIVLKYYRLKFKIIESISLRLASKQAFRLFCTPYIKRRNYIEPEEFAGAEKVSFAFEEDTIRGFIWKPAKRNGHKLLICHGFNSFSYKFKRYVKPLLNLGFEVLAFDAPAHGLSTGKTINARLYGNVILKFQSLYGPFFAIVAHSFGCIATCLAVEEMKDKLPYQLVFIAPATETTRSLKDYCRALQLSNSIKAEMEKKITAIEGHPAEWYSISRIIQQISIPTLWIHDKKDNITPYRDMEHLTKLKLPHVSFIITEGLGHSLYKNDNVERKIVDWLQKGLDQSSAVV